MPPDCISNDEFKSVMRRFAACVNVVTSLHDDVMNGMTATAVCSVSADPPSVLVIVNKSNRSHPLIKDSGSFAVNVLSSEQEAVAMHFASRQPEPFTGIEYRVGVTGCPIIIGVDAHLECTVSQSVEFGTHSIFIGHIVSCAVSGNSPLLYHDGRFCGLEDKMLQCA